MDLILEACRAYADLGCAAVSVTGPYFFFFKVSQESIEHFFRELAKRSPIDIILYNIPQFSYEISLPVVPEVVMILYHESLAGNIAEARRIQLKFLDLINAMLSGTNFPEGFRAGMSLRGFNLGTSRQLLSPREQSDLEEIRGKIACLLAECGFAEAAGACRVAARSAAPGSGGRVNVDEVVRTVMESLQRK